MPESFAVEDEDPEGSFELSEHTGPTPDWQRRIARIEELQSEAEYLVNRRALSEALKGIKRRRKAGEPSHPEASGRSEALAILHLDSTPDYLTPLATVTQRRM